MWRGFVFLLPPLLHSESASAAGVRRLAAWRRAPGWGMGAAGAARGRGETGAWLEALLRAPRRHIADRTPARQRPDEEIVRKSLPVGKPSVLLLL